MKWSIVQLQNFRDQYFEFNETVDLNKSLSERDSDIRAVSPVHVSGTVNVDSQKASFHLKIRTTLTLPCSRTLVDVQYPMEIESIEAFILKPFAGEIDEDSESYHEVENGLINLYPVTEELILLHIPIQVFSEQALKDDSLQSGNGWQVLTEEKLQLLKQEEEKEKENKVDPRLAALADFFKDDEK